MRALSGCSRRCERVRRREYSALARSRLRSRESIAAGDAAHRCSRNSRPGRAPIRQAIRERLKSRVRPVERAAWSTYDQMLKSQGVEEGVAELQSRDSVADWHRRLALKPRGRKSQDQRRVHEHSVDRERPDPAAIEEAAPAFRAGKLVVFPTETVYGLGAHALDPAAVQKIFDAKERPATDPLIVHIAHIGQVNQCAAGMPAGARKLALSFWAGPLTLILHEETRRVPDLVTAGPAQRGAARAVASRGAGVDGNGGHSGRGAERQPLFAAEPDHRRACLGRPRRPRRPRPRRRSDGHRPRVDDCRLLVEPPVLRRPGGITLEQVRRWFPR